MEVVAPTPRSTVRPPAPSWGWGARPGLRTGAGTQQRPVLVLLTLPRRRRGRKAPSSPPPGSPGGATAHRRGPKSDRGRRDGALEPIRSSVEDRACRLLDRTPPVTRRRSPPGIARPPGPSSTGRYKRLPGGRPRRQERTVTTGRAVTGPTGWTRCPAGAWSQRSSPPGCGSRSRRSSWSSPCTYSSVGRFRRRPARVPQPGDAERTRVLGAAVGRSSSAPSRREEGGDGAGALDVTGASGEAQLLRLRGRDREVELESVTSPCRLQGHL